jgi:hypothetical protein
MEHAQITARLHYVPLVASAPSNGCSLAKLGEKKKMLEKMLEKIYRAYRANK